MRKVFYIFFFFTTIFTSGVLSQNIYEFKPDLTEIELPFGLKDLIPEPKPVVALALSGGGARGLAQIGVLRALEEADISVDLVVGTSMGSIVGGLYASGYSMADLDKIALTTNWEDLLTVARQSDRKELFVDQKITEDRAVLTMRIDGFKPILPTAFNDGQKLSNHLNLLTFNAPLHSNNSFDQLKIKFRAVCTNLVTGEPVILKSGSLSKALRASSSVTFFLPPVQLDSLILVDGGLVENIPINTARSEGGEFIIAVNTTSPLHDEERLNTPWIIADQIVSIPMKHLNLYQIDKANIVITPDLQEISANNFRSINQVLDEGYRSALPYIPRIKNKLDSIYLSKVVSEEIGFRNPYLSKNLTPAEEEIFSRYIQQDSTSNKQIMLALYELHNLGNYSELSVTVTETNNRSEITLIKKESPLIRNIDLIGSTALNSERTWEIFSQITGTNYNNRRLMNVLIELFKEYRSIGYSLANVSEISFDEENGRLRIFIDEGIISQIITEGNNYSNPNIITREFPVKEGDFFNIENISKGLINLRGTRLFEDAEAIVRSENGKNILVLKVDERPTSLIRIGFGVDNERKARIAADIREENLFGSGTELGFLFQTSSRDRSFQVEQKANRLFNTYLTYKLNAFYEFDDISFYRNDPTVNGSRFSREKTGAYRQIFYGASFGIGSQVERFGNLIFEGKYQTNRVKNIEGTPVSPYEEDIVNLKVNATVDTQDKYPYPENGIYFNGFYETAQTLLGGDLGYTSIGFEYKNFFKLSSVSIISARVDMAFGDKTLPLTQQYSLGGMDSFFGMREHEYRGRQLFHTSLMFRYKLPFTMFFDTFLKFRYDLGNVWEIQEQIKFRNLKHGIGATVSFDTPIGPAEFAIGRSFLLIKDIPKNPISWGDLQFYFSIGYYY